MIKLSKCGCGGDPILTPNLTQDTMSVFCQQCLICTPGLEPEEATKVWNRAMGLKEGCNICLTMFIMSIVQSVIEDDRIVAEIPTNYCPNCGKKLREEVKDETTNTD